jgi:2-polyprenyl-3-methyl-5-hydroxy-6-metoxy-1,4-benzoquinol methylase
MSFLAGLVDRLTGRRTAQSRWDERWADPSFYGAHQLDELAHYSILAGYAKELKPGGSILDVGCGDGILRAHLHADSFSKYVGIDFPEAVGRAARRMDARTSFAAADMRAYETAERFDAIVFNESLYYVENPIGELNRFAGFLAPGGVLLVSMHRKPKSEKIWADVARAFEMLDRVTIANRGGTEWILGACRKAHDAT